MNIEELKDGVLYCQLESTRAIAQYQGTNNEINNNGKFVRLFGISSKSFSNFDQLKCNGFEVYCVEISRNEYYDSKIFFANKKANRNTWVKINFKTSSLKKKNYFFKLFSEESPEYIDVTSIFTAEHQPIIDPISNGNSSTTNYIKQPGNLPAPAPELHAFYVGQGMCSLILDGDSGFFIDLGAGAPLSKANYPKLGKNDLKTFMSGLINVSVMITHVHYDHWSILDWDPAILALINRIYCPDGVSYLPFMHHKLLSYVSSISSAVLHFSNNTNLNIYRSVRYGKKSANDECIVGHFSKNTTLDALLLGDFLYDNARKDPNIMHLMNLKYDAVVVPHHGCKNAINPVIPKNQKVSKAFFSAGNGYGHPHSNASSAHFGWLGIYPPKTLSIDAVLLL